MDDWQLWVDFGRWQQAETGQMKAFAELHASTQQDRSPLLVARQNNKAQHQTGFQDERGSLIKYSLKG
jgi:hypothetical protein